MQFPDSSFDIVIDKALLDAMVCGDGAPLNVQQMLSEIHRVLTPTGTYICITHGQESQRKKFLKNVNKFNWKRIKHMIQKPQLGQTFKELKIPKEDDKKNFHFMYICRKEINPIIDSDDEEAVAAENARIQAENKAQEDAAAAEGSPTKTVQ